MSCLSLFAAAPGDPLSALSGPMLYFVIGLVFIVLAGMTMLLTVLRFFKRCPSNRVLVIFGRTGKGQASRTIHGGAAFVWPLLQDYAYLSLEPIQIEVPLRGALSSENI